MIEAHGGPRRRFMAIGASRAETGFVNIPVAVTGDATGFGLTVGLAFFVAGLASDTDMRAFQGKVGEIVIEALGRKMDNIGIAALVFGVTAAAGSLVGIGDFAMQTLLADDVGTNLFVTVQAQRGLACAVGLVMAIGAGFLEFRVRLTELAGHQQRFNVGRPSSLRWDAEKCCCR